jgi:queuosine precursor transporter
MNFSYRFILITTLFVTCLITANVIAVKIAEIGPLILPAAVVVFPISYIFGDILTEVYGYRRARLVIWLGFLSNLIFVAFAWLGQILPAASFWQDQKAYEAILGFTPRLLGASFVAYLVGEFTNSYLLAKIKIRTKGRMLWLRTISSTIVGEGLDSFIFITLAFIGTPAFAWAIILYHWWTKVAIEIVATPVTYLVVNTLKRREKTDHFDHNTNFNPFHF